MHGAARAGDGCAVGTMFKVSASTGKRFLGKAERLEHPRGTIRFHLIQAKSELQKAHARGK